MKFILKPDNRNVSDHELLDDLLKVAADLNEQSLTQDENNKVVRFSSATIKNRFGWNNALEKARLIFLMTLLVIITAGYGQQTSTWSKWSWLMGEWKGEGSGKPGQGGGTFSFKPGLDGNILVRKSHSEYPSRDNKGTLVHDDLLVVYKDSAGIPSKAIYFDNEGHTINYSVTCTDTSIVFLSDKISDTPVFRLTYELIDKETVNTRFEMSRDGVNFMMYIEGRSRKAEMAGQ